jgi:hypothetical protein
MTLTEKELSFIEYLRRKEREEPNAEYLIRVVVHQSKLAHITELEKGKIVKIC